MTVVVLGNGNEDWAEAARAAIDSAALEFAVTLDESRTDPAEVTAIVGVTGPVPVQRYPDLRWVHSAAAGVDGVLTPELRAAEVVLTSAAGNGGIPLAEHALMLMLLLGRNALRWLSALSERRWDRFPHAELAGRTVVIVGMGATGQDLATKAKACHMRVIAITRTPRAHIRDADVVAQADSLVERVADCDFLVVAAPLTSATEGLIGEAVPCRRTLWSSASPVAESSTRKLWSPHSVRSASPEPGSTLMQSSRSHRPRHCGIYPT